MLAGVALYDASNDVRSVAKFVTEWFFPCLPKSYMTESNDQKEQEYSWGSFVTLYLHLYYMYYCSNAEQLQLSQINNIGELQVQNITVMIILYKQ